MHLSLNSAQSFKFACMAVIITDSRCNVAHNFLYQNSTWQKWSAYWLKNLKQECHVIIMVNIFKPIAVMYQKVVVFGNAW